MSQTLTNQLDISPADIRRRARLIVISGIAIGCCLIGLDHSLTAFLPAETIPLLPAIASLSGLFLMIAVSTALMRTLGELTDDALLERVKRANSALAESEERFRGLFETSPDAMIYRRKGSDGSMQLVNVNGAYLTMFGYKRSDVTPDIASGQRLTPQSRKRWQEVYAPALERDGFVNDMVLDGIRTDDTTFPAIARIFGIRDDTGKIVATWTTLRDMSAQEKAERKIQESEEQFRLLFESNRDGLISWRIRADGSYELAAFNEAFRKMFGLGQNPDESALNEGLHVTRKSRDRWNATVRRQLTRDGFVEDFSLEGQLADGTRFPVRGNAWQVKGSDGAWNAVWISFRDVSEQVRAERDLRLKDRAIEQSSVAISITDLSNPDRSSTYVNPAYEKMTGFCSSDFGGYRTFDGKPTVEFIAETDADQAEIERVLESAKNGKHYQGRVWSLTKGGKRILRDIESSPVRNDDGDITHWITVSQDVTQKVEDEQQLRLFKRAVEQASNAIAILEQTGSGAKAAYLNPAFEKMTGYTLTSLRAQREEFYSAPIGKPNFREKFEVGFETGRPVQGQLWTKTRDGAAQLQDVENSPVRDESGNITHWISVSRDITKEVEDQQELHLFKRAMEQSPTAITIVEEQDNEIPRVAFVNDSIERMHGFSREAIIGQSAGLFVSEGRISPELADSMKEARLRGEAVDANGHFKRPDGSDGWLYMRYAPVRDASGTITHWISYGADITEQHDAEVSLRRNAMILEQLTDTVFLSGLDGIILDCNQVSARTLGRSREEVIGHKLSSFGTDPEEQNRLARSRSKKALKSGEFTNEIPLVNNTGETVLLEFSTKLMLNDMGEPDGWISVGRDITEKRAAEEELRVLKRAIEQSPSSVTISEVQDKGAPRIVFSNEAVLAMHGPTSGAKIGQEVSAFVASHMIADDLGQRLRAARMRGEAIDTSGAYRRADGTDGWMNTRYAPVRDERNKITHWIAFGTDITEQHQAEQQRRILERALEYSPTAVTVVENRLNDVRSFIYMNPAYEAMSGYSKDDLLQQPFKVPEHRRAADRDPTLSPERGENSEIIRKSVRKDGSTYMREVRSSVIEGASENHTYILTMSNDITKRIESEQLMQKLQSAFDQTDRAMSIMNVGEDGHSIAYVNPAFEAMTGYSAKELTGKPAGYVENRDIAGSNVISQWRHSIQSGESTTLTVETKRKDGSWFARDIQVDPVRDKNGKIFSWVGISQDVTQKLKDEERLRRDAIILENLGDSVVFTDANEIIVECNASALEMFGRTADEVVGQPIAAMVVDKDSFALDHPMRMILATKDEVLESEIVIRKGNGDHILVEYASVPFKSANGAYLGQVTVSRDITEKRALEGQLQHAQKMEAVGQLTGGIAHDFNNLMGVISGSLQLIESEQEDWEFVHQIARTADKSVTRGKDLVDRMLSFSRRQNLDPVETNVAELMDETVDLLSRSIGDRINITLEYDNDLPHCLLDQAQFESAILNMSLNARDAMVPGGHLTISARQAIVNKSGAEDATENRDYICVTIADDGIGMDEGTLAKIYEPFFTTKDVGEGSGLGLSMVYGFVKQSGGYIEVESTPREGTQFSLFFPTVGERHAEKTEAREVPSSETSKGHGRILVVEDNAEMMVVSRLSLTRMGYDVVTADSAAAAMTQLTENPDIKIAFIDIMLPDGMTGTELAKLLISVRPELRILFTSGYSDPSILQDAMDISQVIRKPFALKDLEDALAELVEEPKCLH